MSETNNPKTYSLMVAVLIICCLIAFYFVMTSFWPSYNLAKNQQTIASNQNSTMQNTLNSVQSFIDNYNSQSTNVSQVNQAIPLHQADLANFVSSISDLAAGSGITLTNVQVTDAPTENAAINTIQAQDIAITASGTYLAFKDFMVKMQQHLRIVDVYHLTLDSGQSQAGGTPILEYQIKLYTYYQQ